VILLRKRNQIVSAINPLTPNSVIDVKTGEYITPELFNEKVQQVLETVTRETQRLYNTNKTELFDVLNGYTGVPQPAEFARQNGYRTAYRTSLSKEVLVKSRLEKLAQYKLITETASYVKNPTPNKKEPTFSQAINLGAVDKNMVSLSMENDELYLLWKCWDREYYVTFNIPKYVLTRKIVKFSLPVVKLSKKTGAAEFIFSVFEEAKQRKGNKHVIGIDLGKVIPYSMVVANNRRQRVASYEASSRLTKLSKKRERLTIEARNIQTKITNRNARFLASLSQEIELERVRSKAARLTKTIAQQTGSEIVQKLTKHNSSLIHVENLSWVSGTSKAKISSSHWSYSQQQEAITHATKRIGYRTKKVSAYNTSQTCYKCGEDIKHRKNRTVWCASCKTTLDRDFNAAMNVALQKDKPFPVSKKLNGDTTLISGVTQASKEAFSGTFDNYLPYPARKTT
jgi:transposase